MKVVPLAEAKNQLSAYVETAQHERVLVTRHGKPAALLLGVEGEDFEDLLTRSDPEFWKMIEARRASKRPTLTEAEVRRQLGVPKRRPSKRRR
jgi:prevent-host-death family protein